MRGATLTIAVVMCLHFPAAILHPSPWNVAYKFILFNFCNFNSPGRRAQFIQLEDDEQLIPLTMSSIHTYLNESFELPMDFRSLYGPGTSSCSIPARFRRLLSHNRYPKHAPAATNPTKTTDITVVAAATPGDMTCRFALADLLTLK